MLHHEVVIRHDGLHAASREDGDELEPGVLDIREHRLPLQVEHQRKEDGEQQRRRDDDLQRKLRLEAGIVVPASQTTHGPGSNQITSTPA